MKKGLFISHPSLEGKSYAHPWNSARVYNNYSLELEPENGLLNVLCSFTPDPGRAVEKVTLRATALGIFDIFANGQRISALNENGEYESADEYKPGWTDYRKRVFEFEYDITGLCRLDGLERNDVVAEVSPGWWTGRISFGYYGSKPMAFAGEVEILYADGESTLLASGDGNAWLVTIGGPVRRADIWDGEYYDSRIPEPSIYPGQYTWDAPVLFDSFEGEIVPVDAPPIRSRGDLTRHPQSAVLHEGTEPDGSEFGRIRVIRQRVGDGCEKMEIAAGQALILDMGQNMVGRPFIGFRAPADTKIQIFFAEMLNDSGESSRGNDGPCGSMYIKNYRSALARLVYIANGDEIEYYMPTHAFFGFRYIEIRPDADMELFVALGNVIGSALTETGDFVCDNAEINKLYSNIVWGMRGNYLSIPTDCPQRDERLGWTGDTQIFCGAASYLADIDGFMHKWLADARHSQEGYNGAYCDVIPRVFPGNNGNAAWGDAGLIVPYRLWMMYGDEDIIAEHYDSMETYMRFLEQYGYEGPNTAYGDWLNYDVTDKRYIAVCYYAYDALLMEKFSVLLGRGDRAEYYRRLRGEIIAHWREKYFPDGELAVKTQTGYLLPLAFEIVDGEDKAKFVEALRQKIVENDYTLSTGFVGTGILNQTLSKVGLDDLAYSLLMQTRDPSWLYSVRQGATTIWERWNSYTKERGFGDVVMNSFNHYAYGAVAEWLFAGVCGICPDPDAPGFDHFILRPTPDRRKDSELPAGQKRMGMATASYTPADHGTIASAWNYSNGATNYTFRIPEGTAARMEIPAGSSLTVNGLQVDAADLGGKTEGGRYLFELTAGSYDIRVTD